MPVSLPKSVSHPGPGGPRPAPGLLSLPHTPCCPSCWSESVHASYSQFLSALTTQLLNWIVSFCRAGVFFPCDE